MNEEDDFALRIAGHLSVAAHGIDDGVAERLRAARERALAAQPRRGRLARLFAIDNLRLRFPPLVRSAAAMMLVIAALLVGDYWATLSRVALEEEVDTALLSDDLPIDAYLDSEFKVWLQQESRS